MTQGVCLDTENFAVEWRTDIMPECPTDKNAEKIFNTSFRLIMRA